MEEKDTGQRSTIHASSISSAGGVNPAENDTHISELNDRNLKGCHNDRLLQHPN